MYLEADYTMLQLLSTCTSDALWQKITFWDRLDEFRRLFFDSAHLKLYTWFYFTVAIYFKILHLYYFDDMYNKQSEQNIPIKIFRTDA